MGPHLPGAAGTMRFVYTVWLRDLSQLADDPDYEWPACFIIQGGDAASAKKWGDHLARRFAASHSQCVIGSTAESTDTSTLPGIAQLPEILEGHEASDDDIGW